MILCHVSLDPPSARMRAQNRSAWTSVLTCTVLTQRDRAMHAALLYPDGSLGLRRLRAKCRLPHD